MAELYQNATEFLANEITFTRGTVDQITSVGVYHDLDPNASPAVLDFTTVTLVDGTGVLSESGKVDVLSLIGPRDGHVDMSNTSGDFQRFVLVSTSTEDIIRKVDILTIL